MKLLAIKLFVFLTVFSQIGLAKLPTMKEMTKAYQLEVIEKATALSKMELQPCDERVRDGDARKMLFLFDAGEFGLIELTTPQMTYLFTAANILKKVKCKQ